MERERGELVEVQPTRLLKRLIEVCAEPFVSGDGDWTIELDVTRAGDRVMYRDGGFRARRIGPARLDRIEEAYEARPD